MDSLHTGDLLIFEGKYFSSKIVACLTTSNVSHVGLVWKDPPDLAPGLYFIESNVTSKVPGVQLTLLSDVLPTYQGKIQVRRARVQSTYPFEQLSPLYGSVSSSLYDVFPPDDIRLLARGWNCCPWRKQEREFFVCSTLLAYLFTQMGYLPSTLDWTLVQPKDFVNESPYLPWQGIQWSPLEVLH